MSAKINPSYDAIIIGSGPNGLAAAITLTRAGKSVLVIEAADTIGGGTRSAELTLPGFTHDICSAVHPLAIGSPVFRAWPLHEHGLEWIHPGLPLAHPLDDDRAAVLHRSLEQTAAELGADAASYRRHMAPLTADFENIVADLLGPPKVPAHPIAAIKFAVWAARSARAVADAWFQGEPARGLLAGLAAHSFLPMETAPSAAIGLVLAMAAHAVGWPIPRGGSQRVADALTSYLRSLGGQIVTGWRVKTLDELPTARAILCDTSPRELVSISGAQLSSRYRGALSRFRYGPAAFKVDWALSGPIPWRAPSCRRAGTIHIGGTFAEVAAAERACWYGQIHDRPFVLLAQPSLFDPTRAPSGQHTAWAYAHVPHGCMTDMTDLIESQVERFAPGFRDLILARHVFSPADLERHNPNLIGGSITGGLPDFRQIIARPVLKWNPYATSRRGLYLCSASTPPGAGVHGLCGYFAAKSALKRVFS
ncbi:MAG: phytoene desaturase family protein [Gemmataceae bacterium]